MIKIGGVSLDVSHPLGFAEELEKYCMDILSSKSEFYMVWDVLSSEHVYIPNYYKYPIESCLKLSFQEYLEKADTFPEDIYLFDDISCFLCIYK